MSSYSIYYTVVTHRLAESVFSFIFDLENLLGDIIYYQEFFFSLCSESFLEDSNAR